MSRCLVVGGGGFLGSHLVPRLIEEGHTVIVQDIKPPDASLTAPDLNIEYRWKSILDSKHHDFDGVDHVLHIAAQADVPLAISSPAYTAMINIGGTLSLLDAALAHNSQEKLRILYLSSENVYGRVPPEKLPITEEELIKPVNAYAVSKVAAEGYCMAYSGQYGLDCVILRSSTMYGERSRLKQVIPIFISRALKNEDITLEGDGTQTRSLNYVGNVVDAILLALHRGRSGEVYNVASGVETSIKSLAEKVIGLTGSSSKIVYAPWRPGERELRLNLSIEKAKRELGYTPKVGLDEGLARTIAWIRSAVKV